MGGIAADGRDTIYSITNRKDWDMNSTGCVAGRVVVNDEGRGLQKDWQLATIGMNGSGQIGPTQVELAKDRSAKLLVL